MEYLGQARFKDLLYLQSVSAWVLEEEAPNLDVLLLLECRQYLHTMTLKMIVPPRHIVRHQREQHCIVVLGPEVALLFVDDAHEDIPTHSKDLWPHLVFD